jgi:hypothetical protein
MASFAGAALAAIDVIPDSTEAVAPVAKANEKMRTVVELMGAV